MIQQQAPAPTFIESLQVSVFNFNKIRKIWNQTQRNNKRKTKYKKFILRNCKMDILPQQAIQLLESAKQLKQIQQLDMSQMGLRYFMYKQNLRLPLFMTLKKLDLTFNFISDDQVKYILIYINLEVLYLTENNIQKFSTIQNLKKLKKIHEIDITQNPIQQYRPQIIFNLIPQLQILNRLTRNLVDANIHRVMDEQEYEQQEQQEENSGSNQNQEEIVVQNQSYFLPEEENIIFDGNQEKSFHVSELPQSSSESEQESNYSYEQDSQQDENSQKNQKMSSEGSQSQEPLNLLSSLRRNENENLNQQQQQNEQDDNQQDMQ